MGNESDGKAQKKPARRVEFATEVEGNVKAVVLTGDFTGWVKQGVRLTQDRAGRWVGVLNLAPGEYQYRLLIDGEWSDDPKAKKRVPNSHGSENCVMSVS